jgi:hypothetical protein
MKVTLAVWAVIAVALAYLSVPLFSAVGRGVQEMLRQASR